MVLVDEDRRSREATADKVAGFWGAGALSFPSQINASSLSYCLVDRDSDSASTPEFNSVTTISKVGLPLDWKQCPLPSPLIAAHLKIWMIMQLNKKLNTEEKNCKKKWISNGKGKEL